MHSLLFRDKDLNLLCKNDSVAFGLEGFIDIGSAFNLLGSVQVPPGQIPPLPGQIPPLQVPGPAAPGPTQLSVLEPAPPAPAINEPPKANFALQQANSDLVKKIQNLESDANVASRADTYFFEDQALVLYINKMLIFVYVIIYLIMAFGIYTQYSKMSAVKIGGLLTIFAILPFTIDFISKFLYKRFKEVLHFFYRGNSLYLYEPKKMTDTL